MTDIRQKIEPFLDSQAADRVGRYFHGAFTGRRFERLGGGGDREETANEFVAEDIVAVTLLGVTLDPAAALQILEGPTHERLCGLLASPNFPNHKDLWNVDDSDVDGDSPANQLWDQLNTIHGIAQVIAGKLLARKRPRLIPIYDAHLDRVLRARLAEDVGA